MRTQLHQQEEYIGRKELLATSSSGLTVPWPDAVAYAVIISYLYCLGARSPTHPRTISGTAANIKLTFHRDHSGADQLRHGHTNCNRRVVESGTAPQPIGLAFDTVPRRLRQRRGGQSVAALRAWRPRAATAGAAVSRREPG